MQDVRATLSIGSIVKNRYIVEDLLGRGGFGAVYRVRDQRVRGNVFALKEVIDPNREERERFAFECEVLTRLDHPALPRVYRVFEDDRNVRVYMLMDYVAGPNLEILRQQQPEKRFSPPDALSMMAPIMNAVSYLHKLQPPIIHRDIKPANIIVPHGNESVLVDFGIAKEYEQDSTTTAVRRCSPGYGAPEQYARGTNLRTDIYGLAATLYTLLTGVVPIDALYRLTQMSSKNTDPLEPVQQLAPGVPIHVADAVHRAMAINSNERFATVEEFQQALNAGPIAQPSITIIPVATAMRNSAISTKEDPPPRTSSPYPLFAPSLEVSKEKSKRRLFPLLFVFLALLALVAGVIYGTGLLSRQHSKPFGSATAATKPVLTAAPTKPGTTPTATIKLTTTPTNPAATQTPAVYPILGKLYAGQVTDELTTPSTISPFALRDIGQNNGNISGHLDILSPALQGSGDFTGTVSPTGVVYFVVASFGGHDPLAFNGTIRADRSMSGTYCGIANGQCDNNQGHGTWYTNPPSASNTPQSNDPVVVSTLGV